MLCQKCNKNEANVKYTEIINGEKNEMMLCEECSHELGLDNINFNMPINFSSFFGGLLEDEYSSQEFMPLFQTVKELKCKNCNMSYDEFINEGKFGCSDCYDVFSTKIESLLKRIHGSNEYLGRKSLKNSLSKQKQENVGGDVIPPGHVPSVAHDVSHSWPNIDPQDEQRNKSKLEKLQQDLKKAIADERYEDAAKIRDEIKTIENK